MNKKLIVEGNQDWRVVERLCERQNICLLEIPTKDRKTVFESAWFHDKHGEKMDGIDAAKKKLKLCLKEEDFGVVGLIIDVDKKLDESAENALNRLWTSLASILREGGFSPPPQPVAEGTIVQDRHFRKIGIWLMPNNEESGMLEDFIRLMIPDDDVLKGHAESILCEIESAGIHRYKDTYRAKAFIHTWLAWQETPGEPLNYSIRYLDVEKDVSQRFILWLKNLFE